MQICFECFGLTMYIISIGYIFVIQVGTNRTIYLQGALKATPAVDLLLQIF